MISFLHHVFEGSAKFLKKRKFNILIYWQYILDRTAKTMRISQDVLTDQSDSYLVPKAGAMSVPWRLKITYKPNVEVKLTACSQRPTLLWAR